MSYIARQKKLVGILEKQTLDAFLVKKKENIAYLTGTRGEDAVLYVNQRKNILITDSRYEEEYKNSACGYSVRVPGNKNPAELIRALSIETHSKKIGFEADNFSYKRYADLKKLLGKIKLAPSNSIVENLRAAKDKEEIDCIRKACQNGARLMNYAVNIARPGISENRVKLMIEAFALKNTLGRPGFDIIVASGRNASMPHATGSDKIIKKQDMVIIDLGSSYCGYNSDLTRTIFLGKMNRKYLHIYNIVLSAQTRAIERLRPGVYAKEIDAVSRNYISNKGMGRFFLHSLGHGIGRETHEIPAISQNSNIRIEKSMVITIEPGIYIPGWGGVRIEDAVLITENGCEVLTKRTVKYAGRD